MSNAYCPVLQSKLIASQPYILGCTTSSVTAVPTRGKRSFSQAQLVRSSLTNASLSTDSSNLTCTRSVLGGDEQSTTVLCLEARSARYDARNRQNGNSRQHPHRYYPPMVRRYRTLLFSSSSTLPPHAELTSPLRKETSILDLPVKLLLAGMPMTPVPRVAGAIFRAATDPDLSTSGCPWVLPDDGPVIRVEKEGLREGVYKMLDNRIRRAARYVTSCSPPFALIVCVDGAYVASLRPSSSVSA